MVAVAAGGNAARSKTMVSGPGVVLPASNRLLQSTFSHITDAIVGVSRAVN